MRAALLAAALSVPLAGCVVDAPHYVLPDGDAAPDSGGCVPGCSGDDLISCDTGAPVTTNCALGCGLFSGGPAGFGGGGTGAAFASGTLRAASNGETSGAGHGTGGGGGGAGRVRLNNRNASVVPANAVITAVSTVGAVETQ